MCSFRNFRKRFEHLLRGLWYLSRRQLESPPGVRTRSDVPVGTIASQLVYDRVVLVVKVRVVDTGYSLRLVLTFGS